jgi:hypothetical protein
MDVSRNKIDVLCTCVEHLRHVTSDLNLEVQALFARSRLQAIKFPSLELKMLLSPRGLWLVFYWYEIVALKECVY